MKVVHFVHGWYPESVGGTEAYIRDLLIGQRRLGMEPKLVCGSFHPRETVGFEEIEVHGERVLRLHRDDYWMEWHAKSWHPEVERVVEEFLARERPDLIHVHHWLRLTSNLVEIADRLGIPAVLTLHDLYSSCMRAFRVRPGDVNCDRDLSVTSCRECAPRMGHERPAEIEEGIRLFQDQYRSEIAMARVVLTATDATADLIAAKAGVDRSRLRTLPLGYEPRFGTPAPAPAPLPGSGGTWKLAYWGSLTHRKGVHVLLAAFRSAVERANGVRLELHLLGKADGPALDAELAELAKGLPCVFHGRYSYDQLARLGVHVAVFPMICFETFGFVLDECFELGLPAIVTGIGALPERAGGAARVVTPNDATALADAMLEVTRSPEAVLAMRARIPSRSPTPEEHAARLATIYAEAVAAPRTGATGIPLLRRARFLQMQHESAERAIVPFRPPG